MRVVTDVVVAEGGEDVGICDCGCVEVSAVDVLSVVVNVAGGPSM